MSDEGFGSGLWKNVQSVRFGRDGEMLAPVRADGTRGVVVGVDAVAAAGSERAAERAAEFGRAGPLRRLVARLRR